MDSTTKNSILRTNLLILFGYFLLFILGVSGLHQDSYLFIYMWTYLGHAALLVILSIIRAIQGRTHEAGMYFLTAIIIPIVGFGACAISLLSFSGILRF